MLDYDPDKPNMIEKINKDDLTLWLNDHWKKKECQLCDGNNWSIAESSYELREYKDGELFFGGPIIPVIPVVCKDCGNTILINSIVFGRGVMTKVQRDD